MKLIAISQSNYIPWKGYFDLIKSVDEFVIYDEMQYTKNDWRNRNMIKTINGVEWITIPIKHSGHFGQKINETKTTNVLWKKKHWKTLKQNYSKAPFFNQYSTFIEALYLNNTEVNLSMINYSFINVICKILEIDTKITFSKDLNLVGNKSEKIINICKQLNAKSYISGPAAKNYIDKELFKKEKIDLKWMDYSKYKPYHQLHGSFNHNVTILDLIFNEGENAKNFL
ncbi:WbqC family protein [Polaribacter aquimarinus]|uniref:WbqC-like protein family protein n=1 Tax=Polaribacter aquimarinus TaxID=2100726 RepID=A0A2U2J7E7_9FLAO|nr:WbqC family protein [Polaribacter aquimarinus]PWG04260.1 hypothetical protein DIS07_12665 [Polaribacter aquimarinus]